jgi:malate dehydrogenase (oxaloacetate-decarboxylating)(NADP+)
MREEGLSEQEALERFWLVDSKGLVTASRIEDLAAHKRPYAREIPRLNSLQEVVEEVRPTILIGVSGQPQTFTEEIVRTMHQHVEKPIIFALSNPTSKAECTAEQAFTWTNGKVIFASGSPFDPVEFEGTVYRPGQGNNAYIFPGVGLGAIAAGSRRVTDSMFQQAAKALAAEVPENLLKQGCVYPPQSELRDVSVKIASAVAKEAYLLGINQEPEPKEDMEEYIRKWVWKAEYRSYV